VLVGSVDGTGRFSPFYPGALGDRSIELPPSGDPLAPPVVLDGAPGPERIVVVVSGAPLPVAAVARWAEQTADHPDPPVPEIPGTAGARVIAHWITLSKAAGVR
jgi:hypothetical protein